MKVVPSWGGQESRGEETVGCLQTDIEDTQQLYTSGEGQVDVRGSRVAASPHGHRAPRSFGSLELMQASLAAI